ncbi:MAG: endonuclease/exonuclease/phosphatase family protein [Candidatus Lokiarchaeota archaeon]|nr:endonuclease/exonuclease/phosphatase family protein [Candidatus Lokiarchaeota archaeon]
MLLLEFNLVLLILTAFFAYSFSVFFYRHYTGQDRRRWSHILLEMAIIVVIGPCAPLLTALFFTILATRVFSYLMLRDGLAGDGGVRSLGTGQRIRAGFFRFILAALIATLVVFYGVVVAGRILGLDGMYIISFSLGTGIAVLWIVKKGIPFYNRNPDMNYKRKETIALVLVVACVSSLGLLLTPVNRPAFSGGIEIKTMSFNILYAGEDGTLKQWPERRAPLSDYIDSLDLDVFGLQEVFKIQGDYLNSTLSSRNYTWVGIGRETPFGNQTGEHDAIFYDVDRFDLLDSGTLWFSDTPEVSSRTWLTETIKRTYQWVHLRDKATGAEFYFYNTHYGFYPEFHIKASMQLNGDIASRTAGLPVIVTGDFNMPPIFPFYSFLEGYGSKPVYNAFRLRHGYAPPMVIDYIFVTMDVHVAMIEAVPEANAGQQWLSDHDPVVMSCMIPGA